MMQILVRTTSSTSTRCNKTCWCAKQVQVPTERVHFSWARPEPFNAQEMQTINNNNPSLALQRLDVRVYDLTGSLTLISTAFYFVLRVKERQA